MTDAINNPVKSFLLSVVEGKQGDNYRVIDKYGKNPFISINQTEDIWQEGGTFVFLDDEETLNISSSDINDSISGTGARSIRVQGCDINFNEVEELVELNGTTPVVTIQKFYRMFRAFVEDVGSDPKSTNLGKITGTSSTSNNIQFSILIDEGQTQQAIYTIPKGKLGYFWSATLSHYEVLGKDIKVQLRTRRINKAWRVKHEERLAVATKDINMVGSSGIPEGTDIVWRGITPSNSPNNRLSVSFKIVLVDVTAPDIPKHP